MFFLTCFDFMSVILTFVTVVLLQFLNSYLKVTDRDRATTTTATTNDAATVTTATPTTTTTTANTAQQQKQTNGTLQKQKSTTTHSDDVSTTIINTSPRSSARNSLRNGSISHLISQDSLCDEYQEDEDTLSLENLFPCDQSEIYASKKISFIIDELIQTEENYVNNLRKGLANYGNISGRKDLPEALQSKDKRTELLGNIEEIVMLHEREILPMMLRNHRDLKQLFDDFAGYFDRNQFYCYVVFTMNKKASLQLRQENREWFSALQTELKDKLGIDSFLVQPIQRLTRYPLLLQQFISEFYKSGISCKPVLTSVCKLETRLRRLLEVVNQSEEVLTIDELNEFNILSQGQFRKSSEFDAYHYRSRKKYRAKVFLFDRCFICTEVRKRRLTYRCHYNWEAVELQLNNTKCIMISTKTGPNGQLKEEIELSAGEAITVSRWLRCARKIIEVARVEATQRGKLTLPMDLVMGIAFVIWLIWRYLY